MLPRGTGLESDRGLALLGGAGHARNGRRCAGEAGKKADTNMFQSIPVCRNTVEHIYFFFC